MNKTVEIANPAPGGCWYTSARKAAEYVARGRAYMADGVLVFLSAADRRMDPQDVVLWNGAARTKITRKVNLRRLHDPDCGPIIPMHRPGEVRS